MMIRRATETDARCVAEMAVMMWDCHSLEELVEEFEIVLENEECAVYLYCIGNMPIGFAQCGLRYDYVEGTESSPVGYLEGIIKLNEAYEKESAIAIAGEWFTTSNYRNFNSEEGNI